MRAEPRCRLIKTILLKRLVDFDIRTLLRFWPRDTLFRRNYSLKSSISFIKSLYGIVTVLAQSFICFFVYCFISKLGGDVVIVYWVSCTRACKALWEVCQYNYSGLKMCVIFSESVIRNHRGPVWRAVTTPLLISFLYYFSTSNTIHALFCLFVCLFFFYTSLSLMQCLWTNYTLPMNELIMDYFHTVQKEMLR